MKKLITFLLIAVFSVAYVVAAPPDWSPPKYDNAYHAESVSADAVVFESNVSSIDQSYASIRTEAGTRWCQDETILFSQSEKAKTVITNARFGNTENKWRSTLIRKRLPEFSNNSKYLRSTIYNTKRVWPQIE